MTDRRGHGQGASLAAIGAGRADGEQKKGPETAGPSWGIWGSSHAPEARVGGIRLGDCEYGYSAILRFSPCI